jgi:hypothetical protein
VKRWSHAHTLAAGGFCGVMAATHLWWLCLLAFTAGILVGRFWGLVHWSAEAIKLRVLTARRERIPARPEPVYYGKDSVPYGELPSGY